jgi:hypothetical protein
MPENAKLCCVLHCSLLRKLRPFTRSYIFSQTIFSMRAGVDNRLHGWIIALTELSLFFLPISIIQYLVCVLHHPVPAMCCLVPGVNAAHVLMC